MKTILVSYDLRAPQRDYTGLINRIQEFPDQIKPLKSLWLIKTKLSCTEVRDALWGKMDVDDGILVVDITGDAAAWKGLGDKVGEWIKTNL